jgi:hypothetical protein
MSFTKRIINLRFVLGTGDFGTAGQNVVDITGLRVSANIVHQGNATFSQLDLRVWGLTLDQMNKLTVLNRNGMQEYRKNYVVVSAGSEKDGVAVVFQGTIFEAWMDGRQQPDVSFHVTAFDSLFETAAVIPPTSYNGTADAALILSGLATQIGYSFENSGVTGQLSNPYYPGDAKAQIDAVCRDIGCERYLDGAAKVLAVWPSGKTRGGSEMVISKDTGLVGYPAFTQSGIQFMTLFNPSLAFNQPVQMKSDIEGANGRWTIQGVSHHLDANVPGGQWFSEVECGYLGHEQAAA